MAKCLCNPDAIAAPAISGINVLDLSATPVRGYAVPQTPVANHGVFPSETVDFCNVTVTFAREKVKDQVIVEIWLPFKDTWNDRIVAVGGGGFVTGRINYGTMAGVVGEGFATFTTDAGLANPLNAAAWALDSSGALDKDMLDYWAHGSLGDMTAVGKTVVETFYGKPADYSYYSGCSTGGLQGYALAQRYPDAYDGIAAAAPAIRLHEIFMSWVWPQLQMKLAGEFPHACEVDSLTAIAVDRCDKKDGVHDGIVRDPSACDPFDAFSEVGSPAAKCRDPENTRISKAAAHVANTTWVGIQDEAGKPLFFGHNPGADLTGLTTGGGVAMTTCKDVGEDCAGAPLDLGVVWLQVFGLEEPQFPLANLTLEQYLHVLRERKPLLDQYVGFNDPDLSKFQQAGGKLITFHGLADQGIPTGLSRNYYKQAIAFDGHIADFFRYFEAPALAHCTGNGHPDSTFDALRKWVEEDVAPDSLPVSLTDAAGKVNERIICVYPQVAVLSRCNMTASADCYSCQ